MKAVEIVKGVYWVGAIDFNVRNFQNTAKIETQTKNES